jgi:cell division protein FtsB
MREFKKRRSTRAEMLNFLMRLSGALVLLVITFWAVRGAYDMYWRLSAATMGQQEAQAELAHMQTQEKTVSASVGELSSPRGQEALLREHYGVVRPGEGVVQIVHQSATSSGIWLAGAV